MMKTQTAYNIAELANVAVQKKLNFRIGKVEFLFVDATQRYAVDIFSEDVHTMTAYDADALRFEVQEYSTGNSSIHVLGKSDMMFIRSGNIAIDE